MIPHPADLMIERVETAILDIPLRRPHKFARVTVDAQPVLFVFVHTRGGVVGVGEGVVPGGPWWGGESVESMKVTIDTYMVPEMINRPVDRIEELMRDISDHVAANLYAKTAVEVALHDAWARCLDVPLHTLLGGLTRDRVEVTWAVGAEPVGVVVDEIQRLLDSGQHRSFKLKMGAVDPADDVERIASIADKMSSAASLRVDLNARWDVLTSLRFLPRLAEVGIDLIEQPVPGERIADLAEINRALPIPVMADESLRTPYDAHRLVHHRAADIWSMKVTKVGGLRRARDIVAIGAAAGIPCHAGTSLETGIGTAASLHLACAAPGVTYGSELFGPLLFADEVLTEPLTFSGGYLQLPEGPGLGVSLNPDAMRAHQRNGLTRD
jgi:muconate cycloisomerase